MLDLLTTQSLHTNILGLLFEEAPYPLMIIDGNLQILQASQSFDDLCVAYRSEEPNQYLHKLALTTQYTKSEVVWKNKLMKEGQSILRFEQNQSTVVEAEVVCKSLVQSESEATSRYLLIFKSVKELDPPKNIEEGVSEFFQHIFQHSPIGIILGGADGSIVRANPSFHKMLGYEPGELEGLPAKNISHPDDLPEERKLAIRIFTERAESFSMEKRYIRKDGSVILCKLVLSVIRNVDGSLIHVIAMVEDITERSAAAEALNSSHNLLRQIVDHNPGFVFIKNWKGEYTMVNKAVADFYGLPPEEILGKTDEDLYLNPKQIATFKATDARVLQEGKQVFIPQEQLVNDRGESHWVQGIKIPLFDEEGKVTQLLGISTDITKRIEAEEALRESEAELRLLIENAFDGLAIIDLETFSVVSFNQKMIDLFGLTAEQMLTIHPLELMPVTQPNGSLSSDLFLQMIKQSIHNGKAEAEWLHKRADGTLLPTEVITVVLPWPRNNQIIVIFKDISESREMRMMLKQKLAELDKKNQELKRYIDSNMQLESFAYMASHDLKEPLRTIRSFSQLLAKRYQNVFDETGKEFLQYIIQASQNLHKLINDLLTYSRVDSMKLGRFEPLSLNMVLDEVCFGLRQRIRDTGAIIKQTNFPDMMQGNPTTLKLLFQNLISNAVKFRKADVRPIVNIVVEDLGEYWQIEIRDNGIGIKEEFFERIFLLFRRLHSKNDYPGTGVGLALCRRIVEQHQGRIWVTSTYGKGTSFFFTLIKQTKLIGAA